jgi:membrane fusion protein, copper/silver efflux system
MSNDESMDRRDRPRHAVTRWRGIAAAALVLTLSGVATWWFSRIPEQATDAGHNHGTGPATATRTEITVDSATAARIGVTFATAARGRITEEVRAVGSVVADESRLHTIAPKIDGWVERLYVNATGQLVRAGDSLFTLYSPRLVAAQEEYLLARRVAAEVVGTDSDALLRAAERRLLYWGIAQRELDAIAAEGAPRRALTLYAPASGYVIARNVTAGQRIMAGDPVLQLADLSTVWVEGEFFEQDARAVRAGTAVELRFDALEGTARTARIDYVYPTVNAATRTVRVRVVVHNADLRLKPGMYASLALQSGAADALIIPRGAVLSTGVRDLVFVRMADGRLMPHEVTLGRRGATMIEVRSGLEAGDVVVASATFLVDAESNLRAALGGMASMPGMDMGPVDAPRSSAPDAHDAHQER